MSISSSRVSQQPLSGRLGRCHGAPPRAQPTRLTRVPGVIYYHIVSPHKAAFGITNVRQALIERTQTTLRHVVGARVLQDVIERREEVAQSIGEIIEDVAAGWGVQVESMLIKDIIFSQELQESLSMAAQSKRIGESKIIAAKAEVRAALILAARCLVVCQN